MFNIITKEFQYGNQQVTLETGRIARQANSVVVHMGRRGHRRKDADHACISNTSDLEHRSPDSGQHRAPRNRTS